MYITSPTQIKPANLKVWLDANDSTTLYSLSSLSDPENTNVTVDGDMVGYWGDKSGNNRHFTYVRATTATRPILLTNAANGKNVIRFNGANFLTSVFTQTFANQTIFIVFKAFNSSAPAGRIYAQTNGNNVSDGITWGIPVHNRSYRVISTYADASDNRSTVNYRNNLVFDCVTHQRIGGTVDNVMNGGGYSKGAAHTSTTTTFTTFATRIGGGFTTNFATTYGPATVDIAEVIVYDAVLATWEKLSIEHYLAQKWDLQRTILAIADGNWSDTNMWSCSGYTSPYDVPGAPQGDYVYYNNKYIYFDIPEVSVSLLSNQGATAGGVGGGTMTLAPNTVSISANTLTNISFPLINVNSPFTFNLFATNRHTSTINGANIQYTPTILGTNSSNIYLSGWKAGSAGQTYTALVCAINSNLTLDDCNFDKSPDRRYRISFLSNENNFLKINNSIIGTDIATDNNSINILTQGIGPNTIEIDNSKIYGSGSGSGNNGENMYCETRNTKIIAKNSLFKTPANENGGAVPLALYNNISAYFYNCEFFGEIGTTSNNRNAVYANDYCRLEFYDPTFNTPGQEALIRLVDGTCSAILSASKPTKLRAFTFESTSPNITAYNYNFEADENGYQPINGPGYSLVQEYPLYMKHAVNLSDSYYFWPFGTTFTYPNQNDVRKDVVFSNSLTGTMVVPPASSVYLNVLVDNTAGTAYMTYDDILGLPLSKIQNDDTIGAKLKYITTTDSFSGLLVNSLNFSNYYK